MRRFVFTMDVFDFVRLVVGFLVLLFVLFCGFQFLTGAWSIVGMVEGFSRFAVNVWDGFCAIIVSFYEANKSAVVGLLGVGIFSLVLLLVMDSF